MTGAPGTGADFILPVFHEDLLFICGSGSNRTEISKYNF